jgi:hypothetical protein
MDALEFGFTLIESGEKWPKLANIASTPETIPKQNQFQ